MLLEGLLEGQLVGPGQGRNLGNSGHDQPCTVWPTSAICPAEPSSVLRLRLGWAYDGSAYLRGSTGGWCSFCGVAAGGIEVGLWRWATGMSDTDSGSPSC